ncbi:hypothetical protein SAMN02745885_01392 [Carboxydocella sporoproducens DSM 16521]|uniref:Uncharacterized protein n=2 Tax=Carboxydocella TaxID=178898 RepID=A0A1T4PS58_9FIRM|nr:MULTISPECIES: hypothetical protein [Carboxydocella]AVX19667.1 hypothetical protein CFE_0468 [Carboxydocella thermautotrophica]AVX30072.1 hypothetical protein CTH_0469 [Carboxydocella thermautotrophica]SJZ94392.1 hypothetical protein SAMN02745885_01392 [Carboxydocella sporoproducens DSM 16521]
MSKKITPQEIMALALNLLANPNKLNFSVIVSLLEQFGGDMDSETKNKLLTWGKKVDAGGSLSAAELEEVRQLIRQGAASATPERLQLVKTLFTTLQPQFSKMPPAWQQVINLIAEELKG